MSTDLVATVARARETLAGGDIDGYLALLADDYREVYPQSGELVIGRDHLRQLLEGHPTPPIPEAAPRVTHVGDRVAVEERVRYGPDLWWFLGVYEGNAAGQLVSERGYFARPIEAAAWRRQWVQPIPDGAAPPDEGGHQPVTRDVVERYVRAFAEGDFETLTRLRHAGWTHDMPQSGERFPSSSAYVEAHEHYPGGLPRLEPMGVIGPEDQWLVGPAVQPMRVSGQGAHWVGETFLTYPNGDRWFDILFLDFRDGKVFGERSYWCEPFPPPAWREGISERA